jgi:biphenyl-2,3-diol 1,2-dioxygenase
VPIQSLSYIGLGVQDPAAWVRFGTEGLGLQDAGSRADMRLLRNDDLEWRVAIHQSHHDDLIYAGFEVADLAGLEAMRAELVSAGMEWGSLDHEKLAIRGAEAGLTVTDPDGLRVEIVCRRACANAPFRSGIVSGFHTGAEGLGHIVLNSTDPARSVRFYSALGFRTSDYINLTVAPAVTVRITFMHCNARHHSLALVALPTARRLEHIMFELRSIDEVIDSYNRMIRLGYPMRRHLGRHPNDRMLGFYVQTPAGFDVEMATDGRLIGADWVTAEYDRISLWGHEERP